MGIACCILIGLYVYNEWSFDKFHSNSDRLYRTWVYESYDNGEEFLNVSTPIILGPTLENNIPEIEQVSRIYSFSTPLQTEENDEALFAAVHMVDPAFLTMFDFKLLKGNRISVLDNPQSVVLTTEAASFYFGNDDPINQIIDLQVGSETRQFVVAGVVENTPNNSSHDFDILISYSNAPSLFSENAQKSWFNIYGETYVMLNEGVEAEELDSKFTAMMQQVLGDRYEESNYQVGLQPLTDIHLNTEFNQGIAAVSDPVYSYILSAIAFLILAIACINFMTLSISRSTARAKEVGIRKTIGAVRQHLMYQFWGEAFLMTVLSLGLALCMAEFFLPLFNELSGTTLDLQFTAEVAMIMLVTAIFISLIAGVYPALILSGFRPVDVLKGQFRMSGDKSLFRQSMVVFQFTLSIIMIAGTLIVREQLDFVRSKDLGYEKEQVMVLQSGFSSSPQNSLTQVMESSYQRKELLEMETASISGISEISVSAFTPVQVGGWFNASFHDNQEQRHDFHFNIVDEDFLQTLDIEIIQGRNFSDENPSDKERAIIVNEALVEHYGWDNPLGERLPGANFDDHVIIGVINNFHFESLYTPIEPLALSVKPALMFSGIENITISDSPAPRYTFKINSTNLPQTMDQLKEVWAKIAPGTTFDFTFVDDALDRQYRQEERLSQIVTFGSVLTILIACLGLFGLASLMVVRRTKEIGIRKTLGASVGGILFLVNKEFTKLVLIAFLIAAPLTWFLMKRWLQDFVYRAEIGIGIFILAGLIAILLAWCTVSYQSVKATLINPVDSLKSE